MGFRKHKFDGIVVGNPCNSGLGGVIRDYLADSILSFSSPFSVCSVNEAETILLRKGFRQANRAISCASSSTKLPWHLANVTKEVKRLFI